ncbi:MAG: DUF5666 domain-containing protein [Pseudomonadota bacterium]
MAEDDPNKPPAQGGIGGTGIVGTLTDLGSLRVNGLRIATDAETAFSGPFGAIDATEVMVGDSLTIEASTTEAGLRAQRVHLTQPLVGPVEAISADGRQLRILGIDVVLEPGAEMRARPGLRVAVSGIWRGPRVVASRVVPAERGSVSAVAGVFAAGAGSVGGVPVHGLEAVLPPGGAPDDGSFVTVLGYDTDGGLTATNLSAGRFFNAAGPLASLSVEGYLDPIEAAPGYTVAGLGHSFDRRAELAAFAADRTLFLGPYTGTFDVARGVRLPQDLAARRAFLRENAGPLLTTTALPAR